MLRVVSTQMTAMLRNHDERAGESRRHSSFGIESLKSEPAENDGDDDGRSDEASGDQSSGTVSQHMLAMTPLFGRAQQGAQIRSCRTRQSCAGPSGSGRRKVVKTWALNMIANQRQQARLKRPDEGENLRRECSPRCPRAKAEKVLSACRRKLKAVFGAMRPGLEVPVASGAIPKKEA